MRLMSARVEGFQSFDDSGEIKFNEGINLLIGQNNAGKSAFLRALLPTLPDDRHRTPARWQDYKLPRPKISLAIVASGAELFDWILRSGSKHYVPVPPGHNPQVFADQFFAHPAATFAVERSPATPFVSLYPSHGLFRHDESENSSIMSFMVQSQNGELSLPQIAHNRNDTLPDLLWQAWNRDMFYFAAERMTIGEAPTGHATRLLQNAANLPNVLHNLSSERGDLFRLLVEHMREIFPTVGNISIRTMPGNNNLEVRIWPTEAMEHVELSFPLNSSGTGVSQITALLAAIMTLDKAIFLIDEINSFLHPAAVKNLLRIMQSRYSQHQYIISTHAPEVIGFSNPTTLHLVKRSGYESSIRALDLADVGRFREVAEHLGVTMADVFASDRIVWVEGPTEELCFPYIYQMFHGPLPRGVTITSVAATGDFNTRKRDPAIVYEVYRRLSSAAANLVVSVVFSFDTEKLTDAEKADMQRASGGLLRFLPRRHLECYLIDPTAIADLIARKDTAGEHVTTDIVEAAIAAAAGSRQLHIPEWNGDITDETWLANVDAAKLLITVCQNISEARATFSKTDDALFLLRRIFETRPEMLAPLATYVEGLIETVSA